MIRRLIVLAVLGVLLAAPSLAPPPDVQVDFDRPALGRAQLVDFKLGSNELYDLFVNGGVERARELGTDRIRVWLGHRFLGAAVRSPTAFDMDWELLFDYVQRVLDAGAAPAISFVAAPAWVTAIDGRASSQHESEKLDSDGVRAYAEYVAETVVRLRARFGSQVEQWSYVIWNEPNNFQNAGARYACGRGETYVPLVAEARRELDARLGPGVIALGGPSLDAIDSGASIDAAGQRRCGAADDLDWAAYLQAVDQTVQLDFLTWHWYGMFKIGEATTDEVLLTRLGWFEDRVGRITDIAAGRPHYVEEININGDLAADPLIDQAPNAAFLASATLRAVRQGAAGLYVYKGTRDPSGRAPGGEPDFGLWTSDRSQPPTPAYRALQLLRRTLVNGNRLVRTNLTVPNADALALDGPDGRALAVVNLIGQTRSLRIQGLPPAAYIHTAGTAVWTRGWFDGDSLTLAPYDVAVISERPLGLGELPAVGAGRQAYANADRGLACQACHGVQASGGAAPALVGLGRAALDGSHAAAALSPRERTDLATYLRGLSAPLHRYTGSVRDVEGQPVAGALVLAASGDTARVAYTDPDGAFELLAPHADSVPEGGAVRFTVVHPTYRVTRRAANRQAVGVNATELNFILELLPADASRPLVAVPYVVAAAGTDLWNVGAATAGRNLTVWAVDGQAAVALRLHAVRGHPFGLVRSSYSAPGPAPDTRQWTVVALTPDGTPSRIVGPDGTAAG